MRGSGVCPSIERVSVPALSPMRGSDVCPSIERASVPALSPKHEQGTPHALSASSLVRVHPLHPGTTLHLSLHPGTTLHPSPLDMRVHTHTHTHIERSEPLAPPPPEEGRQAACRYRHVSLLLHPTYLTYPLLCVRCSPPPLSLHPPPPLLPPPLLSSPLLSHAMNRGAWRGAGSDAARR